MQKRDTKSSQQWFFNQNGIFHVKLRAMKTLPLFNQAITD